MKTQIPLRMKDKERLLRIYSTLSRGVSFINSSDTKIMRKSSLSTATNGYQEITKDIGSELCLVESALIDLRKFIEASNNPVMSMDYADRNTI